MATASIGAYVSLGPADAHVHCEGCASCEKRCDIATAEPLHRCVRVEVCHGLHRYGCRMVTIKTWDKCYEKNVYTLSFSNSDVEVDSKGSRWLPMHSHIVLRLFRSTHIAEMSRRNFVARLYAYEETHVTVLGLDPRWIPLDADVSW